MSSPNVEATPISPGVVLVNSSGKMVEEEIFCLPEDGEWPDPRTYCTKNVHKMYISHKGKTRQLCKLVPGRKGRYSVILPAVTEREAATKFMAILEKYGPDIMVCHEDDHKSIRPFQASFRFLAPFKKQVRIYNSQTIFKFQRAFYT